MFHCTFIAFMSKRRRTFWKVRVLHCRSFYHCTLVCLLLMALTVDPKALLKAGDVETNPGPGNDSNLKQTRLQSLQASKMAHSQEQFSIKDVMEKLGSFEARVSSQLSDLTEDVKTFRNEVAELRGEVTSLKAENQKLTDMVHRLERRADDQECRSKRNNLLFYGMPRGPGETSDKCEKAVIDLVSGSLGLSDTIQFDRVHRLSDKADSPIVARCTFYKDRIAILKAKKNLSPNSDISIGEDFSVRVRDIRKALIPHLKAAKAQKKKATLVFDHLLIDNKRYYLGEDGVSITDVKPDSVL